MTSGKPDGDIRGWLAILVVVGGGAILYLGADESLRLAISNLITMVLTYYFGSSQSNRENRSTIDRMVEAQAGAARILADKVPPPAP